eukprot:15449649-Alexandrium_andersonii.AAC.1
MAGGPDLAGGRLCTDAAEVRGHFAGAYGLCHPQARSRPRATQRPRGPRAHGALSQERRAAPGGLGVAHPGGPSVPVEGPDPAAGVDSRRGGYARTCRRTPPTGHWPGPLLCWCSGSCTTTFSACGQRAGRRRAPRPRRARRMPARAAVQSRRTPRVMGAQCTCAPPAPPAIRAESISAP